MAERTTVRLPEDLVRRAKRKAAAEGRTLTALIEDGLRRILDERSSTGKKASRILPRVSEARGGLTPGIDLSDTAALQEMEDLEYAQRLK
jgi:hypothetical protein